MDWSSGLVCRGVGAFMGSLLLVQEKYFAGGFFLLSFVTLSLFTYSKGTWLMVGLGVAANIIVFVKGRISARKTTRLPVYVYGVTLLAVPVVVMLYVPELISLVKFKLETTQFFDTAESGSTIAARWGFVLASVKMAVDNPILGVGISNYEEAYDQLAGFLGSYYWPTDTPHSAFLYILACMGLPAFIVFGAIFLYPYRHLGKIVALETTYRYVYLFVAVCLFTLSGIVQPQLLTQYYFWVFTGVVTGWAWLIDKGGLKGRPRVRRYDSQRVAVDDR